MNAVRAALAGVTAAWRAATPRHFVGTFVVAFAWGVMTIATATSFFARPVPLGPSLNAMLSMQFNGFAVLFAVLVVDHLTPPDVRRVWPYALAVVIGVACGTTLIWLLSQPLLGLGSAYVHGAYEPFRSFGSRHGQHALVVCGLVTYVYVSARWAGARRQALRRIQLERVAAEKQLVESTLAATKSRVDPASLQGTLRRIDALYDGRPAEADAMLRELIGSLRASIAAIPGPPRLGRDRDDASLG